MRVAVVRAAYLNPIEMANFGVDAEIVTFASGSASGWAPGLETRMFRSPATAISRLPYLARGAIGRYVGDVDYMAGLERGLAGFDIAHTAEISTPYSWQAVRAREAGRVQRAVASIWENIPFPVANNRAVARRVAHTARGLDRALAVSEGARLHLEVNGVAPERIEVIPMGVDLERFTPTDRPPQGGPLRVLAVSRLVPEKGVEDLVVAVYLLARDGIDVRATIVGDGPLRARLPELAGRLGVAERVDVTGPQPYDAVHDLYRAHDVFVMASAPRNGWQEQFGFALVEAMASGLPVLAGDSGSLEEVVGGREQLVTPNQPSALAASLRALVEPDRRARLGRENRRRAEERFDRRDVGRHIQGFYERALEAPPSS